ncbi:MAG TPA: mannitol dehydrogenase family protein [Solirubrobacteraceae bacterium]|nr:mannitol dehydrogenase family protein [Solirubrobacteraceae bacterium]
MRRLSLDTLPELAPALRPRVDPGSLAVGIVHLGIGAFHRAHQAVFTEDAVAAGGGSWGICGVTQRGAGVVQQLSPQDGLYTVAARSGDGESLRVVGAVRELLWARAAPERLSDRLAAPSTQVVTLTVTEKGYRHDPATGRLRLQDPDIAADLADRGSRTVIGQLTGGLDRRRRESSAPVTIISCDNLPSNGRLLAGLVREFAGQLVDGDALLSWIEHHVRFPSTMVDRIVPATTARDRERTAAALHLADEGVVVTEPFAQWVIEDDFAGPRPAWERAGAILTADVGPYEQIKLRLLNGSHSAIAYLGALAGHELISDAIAPGTPFAALIRRLMADDVAPTLQVPGGFDLDAYQDEVVKRFANPGLRYRTLQVASDGSQKLPQRLLATALDRRRAGAAPGLTALGVAAWMRFVSARRTDAGGELPVEDPLADTIARQLGGRSAPADVVDRLLALEEIFAPELAADAVWRDLVVERLTMLVRDGAAETARRLGR